jgi:hypothetical protein
MRYTTVETKLINLMLNEAARGGEIDNSAQIFVRSLRQRGVTAQAFLNGSTDAPASFDYGGVVLTLKKYRGQTIREVAEEDPDYLIWIVENVNKPLLVRQIMAFLKQKYGI